jgi:hypothetical protein
MSSSMRFLYFATDETGQLCVASPVQRAIIEVLDIPEDYTDAEALAIIDTVHKARILEPPDHGGAAGGPIRITWAALIERGIGAGVLAEEET